VFDKCMNKDSCFEISVWVNQKNSFKHMLPTCLLRLNFPCQYPAPQRQWRNIQQKRSFLQGQELLRLNNPYPTLRHKCSRLPFNLRFLHGPANHFLAELQFIQPLCTSVRTGLAGRLPGDEFLLAILANFDNSQITTHSGEFVWVAGARNRIIRRRLEPEDPIKKLF
jgi:hypothetical protein